MGLVYASHHKYLQGRSMQTIAIAKCPAYERDLIHRQMDTIMGALGFSLPRPSKVLLKPNLVAAKTRHALSCTHPEFVAAIAQWLIDAGHSVSIGDSPAFGSALQVMRKCGYADAFGKLPVKLVDFKTVQKIRLAGGAMVSVARQALECDFLINLPKLKAHSQLYVSLAVKNFFGVVVGWRKAMIHVRYGDRSDCFESLLVDLLSLFPESLSVIDGIHAMECTGPMKGDRFDLGLIGAGTNPVALDTAFLEIIGAEGVKSPIWRQCAQRNLQGVDPGDLQFPLLTPRQVKVCDFALPGTLKPVTFHPLHMAKGTCKRVIAGLKP